MKRFSVGGMRRGRSSELPPMTWTQLRAVPTSALKPGMTCRVSDYAYQQWVWDGTYWRPAQGRVRIKGSNGNPLAVLSGVASGAFALPAIKIPVGMFFDGATIRTEMMLKKTTSVSAFSGTVYVGPLGTTSDPIIGIISNSGTANACTRVSAEVNITTDSMIGSRYTGPHGFDNGAATVSAISMASDLLVTFGVAFANASDTFHLQHYQVMLEA